MNGSGEGTVTGFAAGIDEVDLGAKPLDTPTLDYLHDNNVMMPAEKDEDGNDIAGTEKVYPESAYTISEGTADDYSFVHKTMDEEGNIVDSYYKIDLPSDRLGQSSNVIWTEVDSSVARTVKVTLPDNETKYYQYTYTQPSDYTKASERINDTLVSSNVNKVVFENISISSTSKAYGGAIYNTKNNSSVNIVADFLGNYAFFSSTISAAYVSGGAIYINYGKIGSIGEINGSFLNNYAKSGTGEALGGAIYTNTNLTFVADGTTNTFSGNYTERAGVRDDNAIYVAAPNATLYFNMKNNGKFVMQDNIHGAAFDSEQGPPEEESSLEVIPLTISDAGDDSVQEAADQSPTPLFSYTVDITGDGTDTEFYMLNDMYDANVIMGNTTINTVNNDIHTYEFNTLTLSDNVNFVADVDLAAQTMDRMIARGYNISEGSRLNVVGMNLLTDAPDDRPVTEIYFAEQGLKDYVTNSTGDLPANYQTTFYTPIYKYNAAYDNRADGGYFMFTKGDKIFVPDTNGGTSSGGMTTKPTGNPSDAFNPSVLSSSVAAQAGAQATMTETFRYVFQHADSFTQLPSAERFAQMNGNKYAISTDFNNNLCDYCDSHNNRGAWVRPYANFESMNLKDGPKTNVTSYGTLFGYDTDFREHRNGWHSVGTGYIGYNGSQISYNGVDTSMNGGLLGYTETFYKGNFWTP